MGGGEVSDRLPFFNVAVSAANLTIQPRTADTGVLVSGYLEHSFISDASDHGHGTIKYVQYKDKSGGYFEFNSECPKIAGVFHLNTEHRVSGFVFARTVFCPSSYA